MRWLTQEDLDDFYISRALGRLNENNTFKFKYSGGWGTWPPEVVTALIVLGRLEMEVDNYYRDLADYENSGASKPAPPPPPFPVQGLGMLRQDQVPKKPDIGMTDPEVARRKAASLQRFYNSQAQTQQKPTPATAIIPSKE